MLKQAITNIRVKNEKQVRKLKHSLINITTKNAILKAENKGFKHALINKKKRCKRSKKLFKEFRLDKGGGAIFFSPSKI